MSCDEQLRSFESDGYLVVRNAITAQTIISLKEFIENRFSYYADQFSTLLGFPITDREGVESYLQPLLNDPSAFDRLPSEIRALLQNELPLEIRLAEELRVVAHEPNLIEILKVLLRSDLLHMHNPPSVWASVPNGSSSIVPPHQDIAYNPHVPEFVTVWVPLTKIDDFCGGLDVWPKTHLVVKPVEHSRSGIWLQMTNDHHIIKDTLPVHPHCGPGDAIIFNCRMLHGSHPNVSDRMRFSVDYRFHSATMRSLKHVYDPQSREVIPPHKAGSEPRWQDGQTKERKH